MTSWQETPAGGWVGVQPFALQPSETLRALTAGPLSDGRLQLWGSGTSGIWTTWKESRDPNSAWREWSLFQSFQSTIRFRQTTALSVGRLPDGRLQLWASAQQADNPFGWIVFSCWKSTADPNSSWTAWQQFFDTEQFFDAGIQSFTIASLSDERLQLWGLDGNGALFSTWKLTTDPNSDWARWSTFSGP